MDESVRTELALFRFSLIAPLVNGLTEQSPGEYLEEVCGRAYDVPGLGRKEFAPRTLRYWLAEYRKHGLEGLKPQRRRDRGKFRALAPEAAEFLARALQAAPHQTSPWLARRTQPHAALAQGSGANPFGRSAHLGAGLLV